MPVTTYLISIYIHSQHSGCLPMYCISCFCPSLEPSLWFILRKTKLCPVYFSQCTASCFASTSLETATRCMIHCQVKDNAPAQNASACQGRQGTLERNIFGAVGTLPTFSNVQYADTEYGRSSETSHYYPTLISIFTSPSHVHYRRYLLHDQKQISGKLQSVPKPPDSRPL